MKVTVEDPMVYRALYDGILNTPRGFKGSETRVVEKLLDKIEAIGKQAEVNGIPSYEMNGGGVLELTPMESKLAYEALDAVPWSGRFVRIANKIKDLLRGDASDE